MNFPSRRKPLALFFYYGFVGVMVGGYAADAQESALAPLRVDPALLGQPPLKSKPVTAAAPAAAADSRATRAESASEIRPVESPVVEARPVDDAPSVARPAEKPEPARVPAKTRSKASAQQIPSRAVAPQASPEQAESPSAPTPVDAQTPVLAPPSPSPRAGERRTSDAAGATAATTGSAASRPPASAALEAPAVGDASSLPPSVDPAQLGVSTASTATNRVPAKTGENAPATGTAPAAAASVAKTPATNVATAIAPAEKDSSAEKDSAAEKGWFANVWDPVAHAYNTGDWEFYLPAITYHSRGTYTQQQIDSYQERPYGFGLGKGGYDEKGNWQGVYAMGFQDSHFKPSYIAGYGWKAIWRPGDDVRVGLGYTAGLMTRSDIGNYVPFPIVLPLASISYKNFSLEGAYVPPGGDNGNVLFIWGKWELGKTGEAVGTPARPAPAGTALAGVPGQPPAAPAPSAAASAASVAGSAPARASASGRPSSASLPVAGASAAELSPSLPQSVAGSADVGADDLTLNLRASPAMLPQPKESAVPRPVFLSAQRMDGAVDREFVATGDAELRKIGTVVNADRLTYWPVDDEMEAEGHVRLDLESDVITGPKMRLRLEDQIGYFEQPSYTIGRQSATSPSASAKPAAAVQTVAAAAGASWFDSAWLNSGFASPNPSAGEISTKMPMGGGEGRGDAERIDFEGENHYRMTRGSYTTCAPGNDDWYLRTSDLRLDYDREVADGSDGTLYFKETPIFYSPWISFSLNNERKSGFLAPSYGTSSNNGFTFALPYYWNIAPNMDATITPTVLSKRGVVLGSEVRYLNNAFGGTYNSQLRADVLPNDRLDSGKTRYEVSLQHTQSLANGWSGTVNYNKVSDDTYYTDLSNSLTSTSQVNLLQQATVSYGGGGWWNATANFQSYQTLQPDAKSYNTVPYQMLPQITVSARKPDFYFTDASFSGQYTNFTIKERVQNGTVYPDAQRTVLYPQIALPYVTPGWYVTPKIGVNFSNYALSGQAAGVPGSIDRTLPIFSVDSGMTFERSSSWFGRDYTQTLEPRLYYLNVPYKDQSQIPIFDTGLADFNFAQIFSENQFSGWDRFSNANQLTVAATSRLLEPDSGNEIARAMLGQRFYFEQNKVLLPGATTDTGKWEKSAFLAAFSGQVLPKVYVDTALQYDGADRQVDRFSVGSRYQPEPGKALNVAYRYNRSTTTPIDQVDVSGQWPITGGLYGVGRVNYAFKDDSANSGALTSGGRVVEAIGGLEYNGGCWVLRGVVQHIATTQDSTSTGFFIQLELSNFSRIGSSPLDLLKRNIQGYSLINQPTGTTLSGQ